MQEQIGRYEIRREIGRGGMATVFLAFDPRFRRQVAIKVLPSQFTHDPKFLERFQSEAQIIAALEHPAIVPVYDFGEHEQTPYLVMRYMDGGSLGERLSGKPLSLSEIAALLERLAPALDLAHSRGIIHRDIKPYNVLFDEAGNPYLADFGIARLAEATHTVTVIGTPSYMSPEQVQGKLKLDGRSDIYSLGVLLFEMLTGRQPYLAETPTGQMMAHVLEPVPDVLEMNPALPPATQEVIDKAMAKDRQARYETAGALAAAVKELAALEAGERSPPPAFAPPVGADDALQEMREGGPSRSGPEEETGEPTVVEAFVVSRLPEEAVPESAGDQGEISAPVEAEASVEATGPAKGLIEEKVLVPQGDDEAAVDADAKRGGVPGWVWWIGALALLIAAALGIRAILSSNEQGETGPETAVPEVQEVVQETAVVAPTAEAAPTDVPPVGDAPDAALPDPGRKSMLDRALAGEFAGSIVSLLAPRTDEADGGMRETLRAFEAETGIQVDYIEADDFTEQLTAQIEAGEAPDVANLFSPALLARFAREGIVVDLREFLPEDQLLGSYRQPWIETMMMPGPDGVPLLAGLWYRVIPKSTVWYPKARFEEAGYHVPGNWGEMIALSEQMVSDGNTPWCMGMEMGNATGLVATDWLENIMLRTTTPENYDRWASGDLPFSSPEVFQAMELLSQIWFNEAFVHGGRAAITEIPFDDAPKPMFDDPPGCWMYLGTPLIRSAFGEDLQPGVDYDFFVLPPIDEAFGAPLLVSGDMMALFNDRPQARALITFLSSGWGSEGWVRRGEGISPNLETGLDWYPTPVDSKLAQIVQDADLVRPDASNLMPPEVGTRPFWRGMTDYVSGAADLETVLHNIDEAWLSVGREQAGIEGDCHLEEIFCIGLVTDAGSVDDHGFNQGSWEGVLQAAEQTGGRADFIETRDIADSMQNIEQFTAAGFDVIVTVGFALGEATMEAAARHPETRFIGVDQFQAEAVDNLAGLIFREDRAGFLAGALAAMLSESGTIGAVLGSEQVAPVVAFKEGYENGARFVKPDIGFIANYHPGDLGLAFNDPEWGAITARQALDRGADVIFGAGGETGNGAILETAVQEGVYCIGVDVDQWQTLPEARPCLVSSAMKHIAPGVAELILLSFEDQLPGGNFYGPAGLAPFHDFEEVVSQEIKDELRAIEAGLNEGAIETGYDPDG